MKNVSLLLKVIAILIPSVCFFFLENAFANSVPLKEWYEWELKQNVPGDKTWSIEFNQEIDKDSVHSESIFIENSGLEKVENEVHLDESGKVIIIEPPAEGYQSDETYTLYVTSKISSNNNELLRRPIKMKFSTVSTIPPFEPREDSSNKVEVTEAVKEVDESSLLSVTESTIQLQGEDAKALEAGDIFFLPATDEYPFGQARKVMEKTNKDGTVIVNTEKPELTEIISDMDLSQTIPVSGDDFIINPDLLGDSSSATFKIQSKGPIDIDELEDGGIIVKLNDLELEKLHTTITGSLKLGSPHVNLDIEPKKMFGITYMYEFNRMEFVAEEKLDFNVNAELSGEKSQRIELASAPIPFAGFPKAGVNVVIYLKISADGTVSVEYDFKQTFDVRIGVKNNKEEEKLEPFKDINFDINHDLNIEGKAELNAGIETGVYLLIGDISLADLTLDINSENMLRGKVVDLSKNDAINPSVCYRIDQELRAIGNFSFGEEIDIGLFGTIDAEYNKELFDKKLYDGKLGNCSYKSIQLLPNIGEVKLGEQHDLDVRGTLLDFDRTKRDLIIPSDYIRFNTSNPYRITINEDGEFQVHPDARDGDEVELSVTYTDPITEETISDEIVVEVHADEPKEEPEQPEQPDQEEPEMDASYQLVDINIGEWLSSGDILLKPDGSVWAFGMNHTGGLGLGFASEHDYEKVEQPQQITNLPPIKKIDSTGYYTLALTIDGKVYRWQKHLSEHEHEVPENYRPYLVEDLSNVIDIAAFSGGEYYLKSDGTVWLFGRYFNGYTLKPIQMKGVTDVEKVFGNGSVLKSDGTFSYYVSNRENPFIWKQHEDLKDIVWYDGLYVKADGTVWNSYPVQRIEGISNVAKISDQTILLKDGTVLQLVYGQEYSNAKPISMYNRYVVKVEGLDDIVDISPRAAVDKFGDIWRIKEDSSKDMFVIEPVSK